MNRRLLAERLVVAGLIGIAVVHALLEDIFGRVCDSKER